MEDYSELTDREIYEKLEQASLADKLLNSPEWKIFQEASDRIVERAVEELATKVKADETTRIIELQTIIRKYKYGLFNEIKILKMESDQLFTEARERGVIGDWLQAVKEKIGLE